MPTDVLERPNEDHTLGGMLVEALQRDPEVVFAAHEVHPMHGLRVQVEAPDPAAALRRAVDAQMAVVTQIHDAFETEVAGWQAAHP